MTNLPPVSEELLPCPFCGGEAQLFKCRSTLTDIEPDLYVVGCEQLQCCDTKAMRTVADAVSRWNTRSASPVSPSPATDEVRKKIYRLHTEYADHRDALPADSLDRRFAQVCVELTSEILRLFPRTDTPSPALVEQP